MIPINLISLSLCHIKIDTIFHLLCLKLCEIFPINRYRLDVTCQYKLGKLIVIHNSVEFRIRIVHMNVYDTGSASHG